MSFESANGRERWRHYHPVSFPGTFGSGEVKLYTREENITITL